MSQQQQQIFEIQSEIDYQRFTISREVIDASVLLKNIFNITDIKEPILLPCSGNSLKFFIRLINQSTNINGIHNDDERHNLFKSVSKEQLIKIIQDLSYLDSDIFLDSVADYILEMFEENSMDWDDIQKYLGLKDDFTLKERQSILKDKKLEYLLSVDRPGYTKLFLKMAKNYIFEPLQLIASSFATAVIKRQTNIFVPRSLFRLTFAEVFRNFNNLCEFPFPKKNLYSLKTDFGTPLNALISRIVQRSNERTRYLLSLINKTIKNEVDRYPLMLSEIDFNRKFWRIHIYRNKLRRGFDSVSKCRTLDESYFNNLQKRKIITYIAQIKFDVKEPIHQMSSLDFVISPRIKITFDRSFNSIYHFDVTKCNIPSIDYQFINIRDERIKFEKIYEHLIAKDLSKEISIDTADLFNFFDSRPFLRLYKKQNASKFYLVNIYKHYKIYTDFKEFIKNYLEDDGVIETTEKIHGIPVNIEKIKGQYSYQVSVVKKYLNLITVG